MKAPVRVLVFKSKNLQASLEPLVKTLYYTDSSKELAQNLIEKDIDFVVYEPKDLSSSKKDKLVGTYSIPFFEIHKKSDIKSEIESCTEKVNEMRFSRENPLLKNILKSLRDFETQVSSVTRELFITQVKQFFVKSLGSQTAFWIDIPDSQNPPPPILRCRQQLAKQKIDLGHLVSELDDCVEEMISKDTFQIWKQSHGQYVVLIWLETDYKNSQCLMLHGIQGHRLADLELLFSYLIPVLNRRWKICLAVDEAQEEVYKDSLTDLYNQKFLNEVLDRKIEEHRRYKTPFSILFIDVDYFKTVNDSKGHIVGSQVLTELATLISGCIRGSDYAFRYGGDEFIILLGHTEGDNALMVAERVRQKVEAHTFDVNSEAVNITVSIGLASYPKHAKSAKEIIQIADEAMYYGKNQSRNVVYRAS